MGVGLTTLWTGYWSTITIRTIQKPIESLMKRRSLTDRIYLVLKGVAMGTVNKIPGVSGGLVALIGGFYEEMIYTFQKFNLKALSLFSEDNGGRFITILTFNFYSGFYLA
jgi:hypothetical protein